jgi:hypothetical protein
MDGNELGRDLTNPTNLIRLGDLRPSDNCWYLVLYYQYQQSCLNQSMQVCNWGVILQYHPIIMFDLLDRTGTGGMYQYVPRKPYHFHQDKDLSGQAYWQRHIDRGILTEAYQTEAPRDPSVPCPAMYCAAEPAPQTMVRLCSRCCCTAFRRKEQRQESPPFPLSSLSRRSCHALS